jgi:hypothetical protein
MAFLKYRGSKPSSAWGSDAIGSQLSNTDIDTNFYSLDSAKFEKTGGTISGNVTISGDLTITGSNTTINTATLNVDDKNIELGAVDSPTNATADGGGITLLGATNKSIIWDSTNSNWTSSENWNIASTKTFKINNVEVLSSTKVQQLSYTSVYPNSVAIAGYDRTTNVVTITTSSAHSFAVNDQVTVMPENTLAGFWGAIDVTITAVPSTTTFRYNQTGANETALAGGYVTKGSQTSFVLRDSVNDIRLGRYIYGQYFVGQWAGVAIPPLKGGTGLTALAAGDIFYASSTTAISRLAKGSDGQVLKLSGGVPTWGTDIDTNTITTIKGGTGTAVSGAVEFAAGTNVSITQSGQIVTINSSYTDTDTNTTYSQSATSATGGANLALAAGGSGSGTDNVLFKGENGTTVTCVDADTIKISSPSIGDGALTVSAVSAADSGGSVTLALSGAYSANTSTARTLDLKVGPALTALATLMSTAGAGFIRRGATADTYSIDTNSYLTSYSETSTLANVTGRGASTSTACNFGGGLNVSVWSTISIGGFPTGAQASGEAAHFRRGTDDDVSYVWGAGPIFETNNYSMLQNNTYATRFVTGLTQGYSSLRSHSFQRSNQYSGGLVSWVDLMYIKHDGSVWAKGDVTAYSDSRVKGNVKTIDNALNKVEQLRGVTYERTDLENKKSLGVIAQEVQKVIPELVSEDQDGMLSVAYGNMVGVLIEAIKELNAKVEDLQKQIANK